MSSKAVVRGLVVLVAALSVIGCQAGGSSPSPSTAVSQPPSSAAPSGSMGPVELVPETKTLIAPLTSIGLSTVGIMSTLEALRDMGWDVQSPEVAGDILLQGVGSGQFHLGSGSTFGAMLAAQKGAPIRLIGNRVRNEWTLYSKSSLPDCASLDGVRLAINSESSPATFMTHAWIKENCPDIKPEWIILPGSENRYAALLVDQIDASPLELPDAMALEAEAADRFKLLTSFAETLPNLMATTIYINKDFAEANPNSTTLILKTLVEQHRKFTADPAYFKSQLLKFVPSYRTNELVDTIVARYTGDEMFPQNGGMELETINFTMQFSIFAQGIPPGTNVEEIFDTSYMEKALQLLDN